MYRTTFVSSIKPYFANRSFVINDLKSRGFIAPLRSVTYYRLTALQARSGENYDSLLGYLGKISDILDYGTAMRLILPPVAELDRVLNHMDILNDNIGQVISKCVVGKEETLDLSKLPKAFDYIVDRQPHRPK